MKFCLFIFFILLNLACFAQNKSVRGRIVDAESNKPIAYTNIGIATINDSIIAGTFADSAGMFHIAKLPDISQKVVVSFIGYEAVEIDHVFDRSKTINLGDIPIKISAKSVDQVVVKGSRASFSYKSDRKVINAENFPTAGHAIDLLENIPSVQLNFEGKLTYRGEGIFKVFINGTPVANGEEKLKAIPVSQIDHIEIITNPSAKYDSEGTAGIIQVILKKNRMEGYMISATAATNSRGEYYGIFSIDRKYKNYGWFVNAQLCEYVYAKYDEVQNRNVTNEGNLYQTVIDTKNDNIEYKSYIEAGFNLDITAKDYISISGSLNPSQIKQRNIITGTVNEIEGIAGGTQIRNTIYDLQSRLDYMYQYWEANLKYEHKFDKSLNHLLTFDFSVDGYVSELRDQQKDTKIYQDKTITTGRTASEKNEFLLTGKIDYKVPLSKTISLETGVSLDIHDIPESKSTSGIYDQAGQLIPFENERANQQVAFRQNIYAGYATTKASLGKLEAMIGLRVEHTRQNSQYSYEDKSEQIIVPAKKNFTDFFPSAHLTFNITEDNQLYASYSRRISRPHYWSLIPIVEYNNPYSFYQGNANLKPSISNAFEIGYKNSWDKDFVAAELFLRNSNNVIQTISRTTVEDIIFETPENVGRSTNIGVDLMGGVDIFKIWNLNCSASIYWSELNINFENTKEVKRNFRIDGRINNTIKLPLDFTFKFDVNYRSPMISAQQRREGYIFSNVSLRKGFLKNQLGIVIGGHNIFNTIKYNTTVEASNLYINTHYVEKPYISFRLVYTFNNQK